MPAQTRASRCLHAIVLALALAGSHAYAQRPSASSVKEFLRLSGASSVLAVLPNMASDFPRIKAGMDKAFGVEGPTPEQSEVIDRYMKRLASIMAEELNWERLEPLMVKVYQDGLTQEEVNGLTAFYRSKVGRSYVHKMPDLARESMAVMPQIMGPYLDKLAAASKDMQSELAALNK
jgi:hypothetical protein